MTNILHNYIVGLELDDVHCIKIGCPTNSDVSDTSHIIIVQVYLLVEFEF